METGLKINIIGRGNVGSHLLQALKDKANVKLVDSHTLDGLMHDAQVTIVSVSDNAIPEVIAKLPEFSGVVAHTSGSTGIDIFPKSGRKKAFGVFYPLQTFSKNTSLEYKTIPFLIEGSDEATEAILMEVASIISDNVRKANSSLRSDLHVAAVLACNFTNHLWTLVNLFLADKGLDYTILLPLIKETLDKITRISPFEAQTGPAVRNDDLTIDKHLKRLASYPELSALYCRLTKSIIDHHGVSKK